MCVWNKVSKNKAILKIFRFWWLCKLYATEKNIWKSKCDKNVKNYPIHMIQSAFESLGDGVSNALWIMMIGQKEKILDDFFKTIDLNFSLAWYKFEEFNNFISETHLLQVFVGWKIKYRFGNVGIHDTRSGY